ncbi:MAG: oxygen-independent coproporphyrinogen III oxidase [Rhodobacteraceae bacterium]|nr:oxygen-independent coproporphyrinogen III oxidase [Paracoccaceae bacterium]
MDNSELLSRMGVYTSRAPRYTSYPTAAQFTTQVGQNFFTNQIEQLPVDTPISIYIHIPFCERLCWFCACRTQGTRTARPVQIYLETLKSEIRMLGKALPDGLKMARLHWGGGTPTILTPEMINDLNKTIFENLTPADDFEYSVEIDPTLVDKDKITALRAGGMTRASIGVQDFAPKVQKAIGRMQSVEQTRDCVAMLRDAGIGSLNMDILYGLPFQTAESVQNTVAHVGELGPDRIALYGYAHVPWMAKRQQLIDEEALPGGPTRRSLFAQMSRLLGEYDMVPIGIDHFAKDSDSLSEACNSGGLRRNFQGYTTDQCDTLIGLGASAISKLPGGYAQNAPKSSQYLRMIGSGNFATQRGVEMSLQDKLRARAIELVMCDFALDTDVLQNEFGDQIAQLTQPLLEVRKKFAEALDFSGTGFSIRKHKRALARLIALEFDEYINEDARFSMVS